MIKENKTVYLWRVATKEKVQFSKDHADSLFHLHPTYSGWEYYKDQDGVKNIADKGGNKRQSSKPTKAGVIVSESTPK